MINILLHLLDLLFLLYCF